MNHTRIIIPSFAAGIAFLAGIILSVGCDDPIRVTSVDESRYALPDGAMVYLTDEQGRRNFTVDEFRGEGSTVLTLTSTSGTTGAATIEYSAEGLDLYNAETGNSYAAFPSSLVSFSGNQLNVGSSVTVSYSAGAGVENDVTYVIPIKVTATSGSVSSQDSYRYIFVKDLSGYPDPAKESGIVLFSCMEINNTNPLNHLSYTLKSSGKPLFDVVIIFSSNIKYNQETGCVYLYHNDNCLCVFNEWSKYIKPLKDRGIKVLLSVLGGGDRSGLRSLGPEAAKAFAKEIKYTCDVYDLDGVFFDDEYSN